MLFVRSPGNLCKSRGFCCRVLSARTREGDGHGANKSKAAPRVRGETRLFPSALFFPFPLPVLLYPDPSPFSTFPSSLSLSLSKRLAYDLRVRARVNSKKTYSISLTYAHTRRYRVVGSNNIRKNIPRRHKTSIVHIYIYIYE